MLFAFREKLLLIRERAMARPLLSLAAVGGSSLLAYIIFAVLPLFLPDTDATHFPPYLALPEGEFSLSNYYYLYALLSLTAVTIFGSYLAGISLAGCWKEDDGRGRRATLVIIGFALAFHLVMLVVPTLLSTDIFDYIRHGRIFAIHGENPLIVPATYFPDDPFFDLGGWVSTGSVYGPLHVYISGALAFVAGDGFAANFLLCRGFYVLVDVANLFLVWALARRIRPGLERKALLFYGWSPLILILVVSNAHNDILMLAFVLASFLCYSHRRFLPGVLMLTLAVLVKFIALPILLVYVAMLARHQQTWTKRLLAGGGYLAVAAAVTVVSYLPLWAGRETFKFMATVGQRANFTLPGLLRDLAAGHLETTLSHTIVQLSLAALLAAYMAWHVFGARNFRSLVSASAGLAFLTPLALFWFQPWYLTMALGITALRPWHILYRALLAFSFSVMFFDSFWWHTPVSMDVQKPLRVLVVFGPPVAYLLVTKARDILPVAWERTSAWSMADSGEASDPSRARMLVEVAVLTLAAIVPMAAVVSASPVLKTFYELVVLKLHLLLNI